MLLAVAARSFAQPAEMKSFVQPIPGTQQMIEMIAVPGGEFLMGSPEAEHGRKPDEGPEVRVRMEPFCISKFEITWPQYVAFLKGYARIQNGALRQEIPRDKLADAVTYPTPIYDMEAGPVLQRMGRGDGKPADIMSQVAARQFTKWLSKSTGRFYRLPTEAEWEYACRAGTTTAYNFGDDPKKLPEYGWFVDNSNLADGDGGYHTVGQKKPNAWGIYDMHGNVGEWCFDRYDDDWYKQFAGKTVGWHDVINWPRTRYPCVIRGGGYESEAESCRSAARAHSTKELNIIDPDFPKSPYWEADGFWIGFRIVTPQTEPSEQEKIRFWDPDPKDTASIESITRDRDAHEIIGPGGR